jgi:Bacterial HORMA domain family 1
LKSAKPTPWPFCKCPNPPEVVNPDWEAAISDASFFNQLTYSDAWFKLSQEDRDKVKTFLPIQRVMKDGPEDGNAYWQQDRTYSSNGVAMPRSTFRPYSI